MEYPRRAEQQLSQLVNHNNRPPCSRALCPVAWPRLDLRLACNVLGMCSVACMHTAGQWSCSIFPKHRHVGLQASYAVWKEWVLRTCSSPSVAVFWSASAAFSAMTALTDACSSSILSCGSVSYPHQSACRTLPASKLHDVSTSVLYKPSGPLDHQ